MSDPTLFQYCPKIVLLRNNASEVLLARRIGEADYDQTYAFIGGKAETTDGSILEALKREKTEEIGAKARILTCPLVSYNIYYVKKDGRHMIVPHCYAEFVHGEIKLSEEYDDYKWIPLDDLGAFEPKIPNIPEIVGWIKRLANIIDTEELIEI